jgi:hypothetical protein
MSDYPECLGCSVTVAETATYCALCSGHIKRHRIELYKDREAALKRKKAADWPASERGDTSKQLLDAVIQAMNWKAAHSSQ